MSIQLTESAARHVERMLQKRGGGLGLRLATRKSGCSGFAYVVDYADEIGAQDTLIESRGIKLVVDQGSVAYLDGMEIDYLTDNVLNQGFEFRNPNIKATCGCGESFSV